MEQALHISPAKARYRLRFHDVILGETNQAIWVKEGGHPSRLYVPRADVAMNLLTPSSRTTHCPLKGEARYYSVGAAHNVIWSYETPKSAALAIAGYLAFYPEITVEQL